MEWMEEHSIIMNQLPVCVWEADSLSTLEIRSKTLFEKADSTVILLLQSCFCHPDHLPSVSADH